MDIERKLLWWKYVEDEIHQLFGWNFLIINEPREIRIIKDKLCYALEVVEEEREIDYDMVKSSDRLHYGLFTLFSPTAKIDFRNVYQGRVYKDRRLQKRESGLIGWSHLIEQIVSGEI